MCLVKTDADVKKSSFSLLGPKLYIELCIETFLNELKETYGNADYFLRIVHSKIVGNINGPIWNLGKNTAVE